MQIWAFLRKVGVVGRPATLFDINFCGGVALDQVQTFIDDYGLSSQMYPPRCRARCKVIRNGTITKLSINIDYLSASLTIGAGFHFPLNTYTIAACPLPSTSFKSGSWSQTPQMISANYTVPYSEYLSDMYLRTKVNSRRIQIATSVFS